MATVFTILTGLALTLGTVSWGMDVWKAGALESNKSYSVAALDQVRQHQAQAEADLAAARRGGDPIAVARAQARRDALVLIEERWDPSAAVRQAEQARSAFIEEGQRKAMIDIGTRIVSSGVGGFGKVQGSYMRGTNWPPTGANVAYWDPQAGQAVRVILGTDRPTLDIVAFEDNLEDAMSMVMGLFDVLKGTKGTEQEPLTARETYEGLREGLERLQDTDALPTTIGGYVGKAMERQIQVENPQIASFTKEERDAFAQELACARLQRLWQAESNRTRADSYAGALAWFGCPAPTSLTAAEEQVEPEEPQPPVQAEEQAAEPVAPPPAPAGAWVRVGEPEIEAGSSPAGDRHIGIVFDCRATETRLAFDETIMEKDEIRESLSATAEIDAPPDVLIPGETFAPGVTFTQSGKIPLRRPHTYDDGLKFWYSGRATSGYVNDPSFPGGYYAYAVWDKGVPGPTRVTWNLIIPKGRSGDYLQLTAKFGQRYGCGITWKYLYE